MHASYAIPVRRASDLPAASFRFHLTMDTLAVRLAVPPVGPAKDLHLQVGAPCRAHIKKGEPNGSPSHTNLTMDLNYSVTTPVSKETETALSNEALTSSMSPLKKLG